MLLIAPLVTQAQVAGPAPGGSGVAARGSVHVSIDSAKSRLDEMDVTLGGIADFVLAGLIICGWPGAASWALGLIVGVNLITSGLAITMAALAGRSLVKAWASATR
jgi:uncharacterized membrane protein HdeD (DUF308 family)